MNGLPITEDELRDTLVNRLGVIEEADFARARSMAQRLQLPLELAVVDRCRIPYRFLLERLAEQWEVEFADLKFSDVDPQALKLLPLDYARSHGVVPFRRAERELHVAMRDPRNRRTLEEMQRLTGHAIRPHLAHDAAIRRAQLLYSADLRDLLDRSADLEAGALKAARYRADEQTAVELANRLFEYAAVTQASDIHIEPYELEGLIRFRIDGVLREVLSLVPAALAPLTARIKVLCGMRIDERRTPQDARFEADLGGFRLDLRVSSLPTMWGEKLVLRVLTREGAPLDIEDLGLSGSVYEIFLRNILRPHGMIIITGPTGSGKSTTLYAVLARLAAERQGVVNISTIEDPVEYTIPRVNQMPINPAAGVDFASGLRALLRQDPDIIMVGEIRDRDTADVATRAALIGRLLLSTLHTNDATAAVPRLLDIGVEPYLAASTLSLVVGQRLVRRICVACRESVVLSPAQLRALRSRPDFEITLRVLVQQGVLGTGEDPLSGVRVYRGRGCPQCLGSGFRGRLGLFELFEVDDEARSLIMQRPSAAALRAAALARGMQTMFHDGLAKAFLGETTIEEVLRAAM
jgi:type II secretory ATPase GspE/PulE/Tfp pilus assembly ATPase PilB-like protein